MFQIRSNNYFSLFSTFWKCVLNWGSGLYSKIDPPFLLNLLSNFSAGFGAKKDNCYSFLNVMLNSGFSYNMYARIRQIWQPSAPVSVLSNYCLEREAMICQGSERLEAYWSITFSWNYTTVRDTCQVRGLWIVGSSNGEFMESGPRSNSRSVLYGAQTLSRHILELQTGQNQNFEIAITQSF